MESRMLDSNLYAASLIMRYSVIAHTIGLILHVDVIGAQLSDPNMVTPQFVVQCLRTLLFFTGTHPPFYITVHPGGHPEQPALEAFPPVSTTSYSWYVDLAPGLYTLQIRDSQGAIFPSAPFEIHPGNCSSTSSPMVSSTTSPVPSSSPVSPGTTSSILLFPPSEGTSRGESSPNARVIAGGVVGGLVGLALIVALSWVLLRRRYRRKQQKELAELNPQNLPYFTSDDDPPTARTPFNPYAEVVIGDQAQRLSTTNDQTLSDASFLGKHVSGGYPIEKSLPQEPREGPSSSLAASSPAQTLATLPVDDVSRRLSAAQLEAIQALVDRNIPADTLAAVINSMLDVGSRNSTEPTETREIPSAPAPPAYGTRSTEQPS